MPCHRRRGNFGRRPGSGHATGGMQPAAGVARLLLNHPTLRGAWDAGFVPSEAERGVSTSLPLDVARLSDRRGRGRWTGRPQAWPAPFTPAASERVTTRRPRVTCKRAEPLVWKGECACCSKHGLAPGKAGCSCRTVMRANGAARCTCESAACVARFACVCVRVGMLLSLLVRESGGVGPGSAGPVLVTSAPIPRRTRFKRNQPG